MDVALPAYLSLVSGSHALITRLLQHRLHGVSRYDSTFIVAVSDWQARVVDLTMAQQPLTTKEKFWDEPLVRAQELSEQSGAPDQTGREHQFATARCPLLWELSALLVMCNCSSRIRKPHHKLVMWCATSRHQYILPASALSVDGAPRLTDGWPGDVSSWSTPTWAWELMYSEPCRGVSPQLKIAWNKTTT